MVRRLLLNRSSMLMPLLVAGAIFGGVVAGLTLFGGTDASPVHAQRPDDPFEAPSTMGEQRATAELVPIRVPPDWMESL